MWRSARQAASKRTRTIPGARERVLGGRHGLQIGGTPGGTSSGFDRPDSSSSACGEKGRRIISSSGFRSTPDSDTVGGFDFEFFFAHQRDRIGGREFS